MPSTSATSDDTEPPFTRRGRARSFAPELAPHLAPVCGRVAGRRDEARTGKVLGRPRERPPRDEPLDVGAVDLVHLGVAGRVALEPEVGRVDRLLVHPLEDLGA